MVDRVITVRFDADTARLEQAYKKVGAGAQNVAKQTAAIDSSAKSSGSSLAGLASRGLGLIGLGAVVKGVVGGTVDFQKSLNTLKAVGGATAAQMAQVSKAAQDLGKDTSLAGQSAGTAAQAMTELVKGGLSVDQALKAARGTLELATAAQIDGARAATIQANALNTFGLAADKAGHVADLLSNAANKSSGEIDDFAQALAQGGLVAQGAGISIDDTVTALAEFAQAGLKGSDAGTSLKTALLALQTPTVQQSGALETLGVKVYDAQGNFEGLRSLSEQLGKAQKGMSQEAFNSAAGIAFGSDAVRAAQVFAKNGAAGWDDYSKAMAETGSAAKLAAANTEGLPGALANLKNSAEGLALSVGTSLAPILTTAADGLSGLLGIITKIPTPVFAAVAAFVAFKKIGGSGFVTGFSQSMRNITTDAAMAGTSVTKLGAAAQTAKAKFAGFGKALAGGAVFAGLGFAVDGLSNAFEEAKPRVTDFSSVVDSNTGALLENADAAAAAALAASGAFDRVTKLGVGTKDYTSAILGDSAAMGTVAGQLRDALANATDLDSLKAATEGINQLGGDLKNFHAEQEHGRQVQDALGDAQAVAARQQSDYVDSLLASHGAAIKNNFALRAVTVTTDKAVTAAAHLTTKNILTASTQNVLATANEATAKQVERAQRAYDHAVGALRPMEVAADRAADKMSRLQRETGILLTALDKLSGRVPTVEQATRDLDEAADDLGKSFGLGTDSVTELSDSLIKADGSIKTADESGRTLLDGVNKQREAMVTAAKAAFDAAGGQNNLTKATDAANKVVAGSEQQLRDTLTQLGLQPPAIDKVVKAYGFVPKNVTTAIKADSKEALDKAAEVKRKLEILNQIKSLSTIDAADYASAKLAAVKRAIDDFHNKKVKLTIEQENLLQGVADSVRIPSGVPGQYLNAEGGLIRGPGTGTSDSILSRVSNGEFVVRASETAKHLPLLHAINEGKVPGFASGGRVDVDMQAPNLSGSDATAVWRIIYAAADKAAAASAATPAASPGGSVPPSSSAGVEQWRALATQVVLGHGLPLSVVEIMLTQMAHESGGNPAAINLTDINAQQGHPSVGLLQFIPSTFAAYADPGYNTNIYDPESQMRAFLNYVPAAYGSFDYLASIGFGPYARGGRVRGPGSGTSDSGLARVSNGEFLVNAQQAGKHGPLLNAINSGALPGFAAGGPVLPSGSVIGGYAAPSMGTREGAVFQGDQALIQYVRELGQAAVVTAQQAKDSAAQLVTAEDELGRARKEQHDLGNKASADEKARAKQAVKDAEARRDAAKKQAAGDLAVSTAAKKLYDAQRTEVGDLTRDRARIGTDARRLDTLTARRGSTQSLLDAARGNRASAIDSRAGSIAGIGGGLLGFAEQRTTPQSILAGQRFALKQIMAYSANVTKVRGLGASADVLATIGDGSADAVSRAAILARGGRGVVQQSSQLQAQINAVSRRTATVVEDRRSLATIQHLEKAAVRIDGQIATMAKEIATIDRRISNGLRGVLNDLADAHMTEAARR